MGPEPYTIEYTLIAIKGFCITVTLGYTIFWCVPAIVKGIVNYIKTRPSNTPVWE